MIDLIMFRQRIGDYFNSKTSRSHYEKVNMREYGSTGNVLNDMCVILLMIYLLYVMYVSYCICVCI